MPLFPSDITSPFRMQPGLSRLPPGQAQLTPNRPGDAHLDAKLAVLRAHAEQALCRLPDFDDGPALAALAAHATREHPEAWHSSIDRDGRHCHGVPLLGWCVNGERIEGDGPQAIGDCLHALPPQWRAAGLLSLAFAEDLAVIETPPGGSGRIPWLAVCLPSHWAPETRLGLSFADVHAPVADNEALLRAADGLSQLVVTNGAQRWQRKVWTLTASGHLDGHPRRRPAADWPADADARTIGDLAWLRSEQQSFIPVPGQPQAVFTILVKLRRLREVLADPLDGSAFGRALHAAIASMSPAVLAYRRLDGVRDRLLAVLAAVDRSEEAI
ncbi:heme-dependent oxidative N-demethylase subunit alpha family protein [Piscinibacter sakaiensis]|uniref:heme-dependent oxidative N-demethylase subunit alpha family protein n=1 Tax=Piscinibacter sakaiensis TaxID=1547922 RepID=UPI003AAF4779